MGKDLLLTHQKGTSCLEVKSGWGNALSYTLNSIK